VTIRANHPFAFAIVDTQSGAPLFIGQVADPTGTA
jgi:serine protease inhibitor